MSSRLVPTALAMRTVARSAAITATRCSNPPRVEYVNRNTNNFATLDDSRMESPAKIKPSTNPSFSLPWPVEVFAKAREEDRKLDQMHEMFVLDEQHSKVDHAWEPSEKELWLERFGGPGKTLERVVGNRTVVLRDVGRDGKGYLRILV